MKRNLSLLLGFLAVVAGCQKTESTTEIVLEIATNIPVPTGMDTLSLKIGPQANPQAFFKTYPLGEGKLTLPRRMTLVPTDTNTALSVLVEGLLGDKTVVSRSVLTKFAKGESKLLRIELLQKCVGQVCPDIQTCTPTAFCADPFIDPVNLPPFDSSKAPNTPGFDPDAGVSIDAPLDQAAGDGKNDGLSGKDGDRMVSDGQLGPDGTPSAPETLGGDGPGGTVFPGPDVNPDTGSAADAPVNIPDVPPSSRTKGVACGLSDECESGLCIDGVCCESKCDGMCMACNVPGKLGTCAFVPLNDPSNGDCPDDGGATCGRNGKCDGLGGCMMYPSGVACSAETCPAGTSNHTGPGLCDGKGHCGQGQPQNCAPFTCNATTKTCNPSCTVDSECVAPNRCIAGSCGKKANGQPCSGPGDCQSDVCAQGVCCQGPCSELCKSCAVEGSLGTCSNVPSGKPEAQARCQDMGGTTCGTNGLCDGAGACQKYGASQVCGGQCNIGAASFTGSTCSAGACTPGPAQPCSPYSCDSSGCKKSCSGPSDCALGFVCGAGGLCVRPPEDCMNGVDDDGDGQIDCADTDCQAGFTCVPTVPPNFTGPVELFDGADAQKPACGGPYPDMTFDGYGSLQCPFTCNGCQCGIPTNVTCSNPSFGLTTVLDDGRLFSCVKPSTTTELKTGTCQAVPSGYSAFAGFAGTASSGSCSAPTGGDKNLGPVTWNAGRVCASQAKGGGGCAKDFVCWPKPQAPYQPQACVIGSGSLSCPTTGYTSKRDYFADQTINDTRACSGTCGCTFPTGAACGGTVDVFATTSRPLLDPCDRTALKSAKIPTACVITTAEIGYLRATTLFASSCTSTSTVAPTGGCTPAGKQATVCCMP